VDTKTTEKPVKQMIHIRLDAETHRHLKVRAAQLGISIQKLVEGLILEAVNNKDTN
jgi:predicted HicB family RNase H-like nuclease